MNSSSVRFLNPAEAAARLGVSAKALRLYEQRGLVTPSRTAAGWRAYGPDDMARGAEIVALRALGLSLAQVGRVLEGDAQGLEPALAAHKRCSKGGFDNLATRSRRCAICGPASRGGKPRPPAAASAVARDSTSNSNCPGPGNASSCAASGR